MPEIKLHKRCKYAGEVFVALLKMGYGIEAANAFCDNIKDADVEEVVRCKDCESFGIYESTGNGYCKHQRGLVSPNPLDFCSFGERK